MKRFWILTLVLLLAAVPALAENTTMRVNSSAVVSLNPDHGVVILGVSITRFTAQQARDESALIVSKVLEAIKAQGIPEEDIATESFNLDTLYDYDDGERIFMGYRLENLFRVTVRDMEKVAQVLDAGIIAGANLVENISFESEKTPAAAEQALDAAIVDGLAKAQRMAKAAGKELGDLISLQEIQGYVPVYRTKEYNADMVTMGATPVIPSQLQVTATVELVFELR